VLLTGVWAKWDRDRLQRTSGTLEHYMHPCLIADPQLGARLEGPRRAMLCPPP
jgi:hypothetical protein